MKNRYDRIPPKLTLALGAVFLLLALCYAWTALDYAMPTQELALRTAETETGVLPGEIVYRFNVREVLGDDQNLLVNWGEHCLFTRRGERAYLFCTDRVAGVLWDSSFLFPLSDGVPVLLANLRHNGFRDGEWYSDGVTILTAVAAAAPAARVTITQALWPGKNCPLTEEEYLDQYGVTVDCTEAAPGSGIWLGQQLVPPPHWKTGGYGYTSVARAYAADGTLLYPSA